VEFHRTERSSLGLNKTIQELKRTSSKETRMLKRFAPSLVVLLTIAVLPSWAQVAIDWKLKEGDTFYLQTVTKSAQKMKALGKDMNLDMEQTLILGFKVEKKEADGTLVLKQTVEEMLIKNASGTGQADDKLKGATFMITLNPKWEVTKFEGYDAFIKRLTSGNDEDEKKIKAIISEDTMKQSVKLAFAAYLPDRPMVKPADTWTKKVDLPLGPLGTIETTNSYKYDGKGKVNDMEYDKISFISGIKYRLPKEETNQPYQVTKGDLKSKDTKGVIYFDTAEGHLVEMESTMPLEGNLTLSSLGQPVDATLDQKQEIKVTYSKTNPKSVAKPAEPNKP
jgi:hypothetical protein